MAGWMLVGPDISYKLNRSIVRSQGMLSEYLWKEPYKVWFPEGRDRRLPRQPARSWQQMASDGRSRGKTRTEARGSTGMRWFLGPEPQSSGQASFRDTTTESTPSVLSSPSGQDRMSMQATSRGINCSIFSPAMCLLN